MAKTHFEPYKVYNVPSPTLYKLTGEVTDTIPKAPIPFFKRAYVNLSNTLDFNVRPLLTFDINLFTGMEEKKTPMYVGILKGLEDWNWLNEEDEYWLKVDPSSLPYYRDSITPVYSKHQMMEKLRKGLETTSSPPGEVPVPKNPKPPVSTQTSDIFPP